MCKVAVSETGKALCSMTKLLQKKMRTTRQQQGSTIEHSPLHLEQPIKALQQHMTLQII